ncbi:MAG: outer membrane lipoprotein carrier protein LolA [Candidatus Cloacimonas sp.]|jgi:outer membrane lipoprotein-sorting protein|nr:outer membrane lipoprotein carrier protein LolA [Candidatus Cloacimonas sp.]
MKTIKLAILFLLASTILSAQSTDALYLKISKVYGEVSSFQAEIKQDNYYAQIKKSISYQGKIFFSKGKMVIRFEKPNFQRLMINGNSVSLYDAQSKTVFRSRMRPEFGKMNPVEILQHYWKKSKVTVLDKQGTLTSVQLIPYSDPLIASLTANISNKTGFVMYLSYTDVRGNKVGYNFSSIKTNAPINASVWNYAYPKDVQMVEQ